LLKRAKPRVQKELSESDRRLGRPLQEEESGEKIFQSKTFGVKTKKSSSLQVIAPRGFVLKLKHDLPKDAKIA